MTGASVLRNENLPFIRVYDLSPAGIRIGLCESLTLLLAHVVARLNIAGRSGADFWNDLDLRFLNCCLTAAICAIYAFTTGLNRCARHHFLRDSLFALN